MWFDTWSDVVRVLAVGAATYVFLVVLLRVSGKRTLAKLNAFDWVVTVALGSTVASILLSSDVSWIEGVTALSLLAALQFVVAWSTTHLPGGRSIVTARPTLLLQDGVLLEHALRQQRVSMGELRQAVRASGSGDLSSVAAAVLETDGSISVISQQQAGNRSALEDVPRDSS